MDLIHCRICLIQRSLKIRAKRRYAEHSAAGSNQFTVFHCSAGVIDGNAVQLTVFQTGDLQPFRIRFRIAAGGDHNAGTGIVRPFYIQIGKRFILDCLKNIYNIRLQARKNNLRFGIAEPAVIFYYFRAFRCDHQTEIETAFKGSALFVHCLYRGDKDLFHTFICHFGRIIRIR